MSSKAFASIADAGPMRTCMAMYIDKGLKLGLFAPNRSCNRAATLVPAAANRMARVPLLLTRHRAHRTSVASRSHYKTSSRHGDELLGQSISPVAALSFIRAWEDHRYRIHQTESHCECTQSDCKPESVVFHQGSPNQHNPACHRSGATNKKGNPRPAHRAYMRQNSSKSVDMFGMLFLPRHQSDELLEGP
jgi:hypothetical protein